MKLSPRSILGMSQPAVAVFCFSLENASEKIPPAISHRHNILAQHRAHWAMSNRNSFRRSPRIENNLAKFRKKKKTVDLAIESAKHV